MGQGGRPPYSLVAPPQIQKLADRSEVISDVPKCSKIKIFRGSAPDQLGSLQRSPDSYIADSDGARCPPKNPTPLSALVSMGLGDEGADGGNAPKKNLGLEPPLCRRHSYWRFYELWMET